MKHLATILLLALCATASAQTIKTLGYNTTNGEVVYSGTNTLHITNDYIKLDSDLAISNNAILFGGDVVYEPETGAFYTDVFVDSAKSLAVGVDGTNSVSVGIGSSGIIIEGNRSGQVIELIGTNLAPTIRADLGLPWTGLTNTNAATFQGALFSATNAAPTNTNAPTPDAWVDITVGTNVFKLPLWQ
mgnify:CR=1 FL=1